MFYLATLLCSLSLHGSNDKDKQKLVPLMLRVVDDLGMVKSKFMRMCLCYQATADA